MYIINNTREGKGGSVATIYSIKYYSSFSRANADDREGGKVALYLDRKCSQTVRSLKEQGDKRKEAGNWKEGWFLVLDQSFRKVRNGKQGY